MDIQSALRQTRHATHTRQTQNRRWWGTTTESSMMHVFWLSDRQTQMLAQLESLSNPCHITYDPDDDAYLLVLTGAGKPRMRRDHLPPILMMQLGLSPAQ